MPQAETVTKLQQ